jgi:phosphatidylglycerophosphatase A
VRHWGLHLWIAQGFGIGRIPFAPGTFGSVLGVLWFAILLSSRNLWLLLAGTLVAVALSVWLCGVAEKVLHQTDPGSVVLDEIAAMPVCYFSWLGILLFKHGSFPAFDDFFGPHTWPLSIGIFAAFRFFDVVKPWPVRQSQSLPAGWGVTIDDLLAAVYVNILTCAVYLGKQLVAHPGTDS